MAKAAIITNPTDPRAGVNWKHAISWALYDWANSAFAVAVMSGFVPVLNKISWNAGVPATVSTFRLTVAISTASLLCAVLAPVLGAIADRGGAKKKFLLAFASLGAALTAALFFVSEGQWFQGLAIYGLALAGFSGANVFYDALLLNVSSEQKLDVVSALGYALGYIGSGLLFALNVFMVLRPAAFGLANETEAMRWAFVMVAVWWVVFSVPLLVWVPEPQRGNGPARNKWAIIKAGFADLFETLREIRQLRKVWLFLIGYWLYIDGVGTVIKTAVDYGGALGFESRHLVTALLVTQFVGFPAALVFGRLGERFGAQAGILIGLAVYIGVCIWGYFMHSVSEFYVIAVSVGLVQGGVQSLSRSFFARLIPPDRAGQFFGFYNMLGKFAAILGPILMGLTAVVTGNSRVSILALIGLFVGGAVFLVQVRVGGAAIGRGDGAR